MRHISPTITDPEILQEIGERLLRVRRSRDLTMAEVAEASGLSTKTVSRAEQGLNPTLLTVVRLLRVYERLAALDDFVPAPEVSPMAIVRAREGGGARG